MGEDTALVRHLAATIAYRAYGHAAAAGFSAAPCRPLLDHIKHMVVSYAGLTLIGVTDFFDQPSVPTCTHPPAHPPSRPFLSPLRSRPCRIAHAVAQHAACTFFF